MPTASPDRRSRTLASRLAVAILPAGALFSALLFSVGNLHTLRARREALASEREAFLRERAGALATAMSGLEGAVEAAASLAFADGAGHASYADAFAFLRAVPAVEAVSLVAFPESGPSGVLAWRDAPHFRRRPLAGGECEEDAFRLALLGQPPVWTHARHSATGNGETLVVSARAAGEEGKGVAGVAAANVPAGDLTDILAHGRPYWAEWLLLARDGTVLRSPGEAWVEGENLHLVAEETGDRGLAELAKAMNAGESGKRTLRLARGAAAPRRIFRYRPVGKTGLSLALVSPDWEGYWNPIVWPRATAVVFLLGLAGLCAVVFRLTKSLTRPFAELSQIALSLARGDAAEAAALARSLRDGRKGGVGIREYAAMAEALGEAAGRASAAERENAEKAGRLRRGADALAAEVAALREGLSARAASARFLAGEGEEGARLTGELANRIATAAGSAMSHATLLSSGGARLAQATANAEDLRRETDILLKTLGDVAEKAEDLIGTVEGLQSSATNVDLLAVNAAMEGERAGEAGKGFGAIAREIRHLSTRTTETAGRIASGAAELVKAAAGAKDWVRAFSERLANRIDEVRSVEQRLASRIDGAKETAETYRGTAEELQRAAGRNKSISEEGGKLLRTGEALAERLEKIEAAAAALRAAAR